MQGQRGASVGCPAGSSCLREGTLPRRNGEQRGCGSKGAVLSLASGGAGPSPGGHSPAPGLPGQWLVQLRANSTPPAHYPHPGLGWPLSSRAPQKLPSQTASSPHFLPQGPLAVLRAAWGFKSRHQGLSPRTETSASACVCPRRSTIQPSPCSPLRACPLPARTCPAPYCTESSN